MEEDDDGQHEQERDHVTKDPAALGSEHTKQFHFVPPFLVSYRVRMPLRRIEARGSRLNFWRHGQQRSASLTVETSREVALLRRPFRAPPRPAAECPETRGCALAERLDRDLVGRVQHVGRTRLRASSALRASFKARESRVIRLPRNARRRDAARSSFGAFHAIRSGHAEAKADGNTHVGMRHLRHHRAVVELRRAHGRPTADGSVRRAATARDRTDTRASINSSPLFISVAESIEIFAPIDQFGWRTASSGVTLRETLAAHGTERPA
jgi:hypothetical protein